MKNRLIILLLVLTIIFVIVVSVDFNRIDYSEAEKEFIKAHDELVLAPDPSFAPVEFFNTEGKFSGINSDYIAWINENTDLNIVIAKYDRWDEIINDIKDKRIDMLSGVASSSEREKYLKFTKTYIEMPIVVITREGFSDFSMDDLEKLSIVVVDSYFTQDFLEAKYPNKSLVKVKTVEDGIKLVSFGQADSYVGSLGAISYYLEESGISNIKVAGEFSEGFNFKFAVRDDYVLLVSILDKIIDKMPEQRKKDILSKWITLYPKDSIFNEKFITNILIITGVLSMAIILSLIWNYTLKKEVEKKANIIKELNENEKDRLRKILNEKTKELNKTHKELIETEKIALVGRLVSGVAHEVNTPLGVAITAASHLNKKNEKYKNMLNDGSLSRVDLEEYMYSIDEATEILTLNLEKAGDLVKNFKKIAVNQNVDEKVDFNLKEYIESILTSLNYRIKKVHCNIHVDCPNDIELYSHPGLFSQVLTNLIMNSIKHGLENREGNIDIIIRELENKLSIEYSDDGAGIEKKYIDKIFEPFFTTKRDEGGSGLGLNIVYSIITSNLKGSIEVSSKKGEGTKFSMLLPMERIK